MKKEIKMTSEFAATYKDCRKIGDKYITFNPALKVTKETTIGEIFEWYKTYKPATFFDIRIAQMENLV